MNSNNVYCHCYSIVLSKTQDTEEVPKDTGRPRRVWAELGGKLMTKMSVQALLFMCQPSLAL